MNTIKFVGIALIIAGIVALGVGSFSYTKDSEAIKLGPFQLSVKEKQTVNIPIWSGVAAIVAGGLILVFGGKKK